MLTQVVGAHVHQLHSVQSGTAVVGVAASMGSTAFEVEFCGVQTGHNAAGSNVGFAGMVSESNIQITESAVSCHKGFTGQQLLTGAAIENNGTFQAFFLHLFFHADGSADVGNAQQVVATALAGSTSFNRGFFRFDLLAHTGKSVILAQKSNNWMAGAKGSTDSSGNTEHTHFNLKTGGFQSLGGQFASLILKIADFWFRPDFVAEFI